jgi:hypothetical protein
MVVHRPLVLLLPLPTILQPPDVAAIRSNPLLLPQTRTSRHREKVRIHSILLARLVVVVVATKQKTRLVHRPSERGALAPENNHRLHSEDNRRNRPLLHLDRASKVHHRSMGRHKGQNRSPLRLEVQTHLQNKARLRLVDNHRQVKVLQRLLGNHLQLKVLHRLEPRLPNPR